MGLNLEINRIIFSSVSKFKSGLLEKSLVKQIAGRAGRSSKDGYVAAMWERDLDHIKDCLGDTVKKGEIPTDFDAPEEILDDFFDFSENQKEIKKACLFPAIQDVLNIASKLQEEFNNLNKNKVSIYDVFLQFDIHSNSNDLYFIKQLKKILKVAYILKDVDSTIEHQFSFVMTPCKTKEICLNTLKQFFIEFKDGNGIVLIPENLCINKKDFLNRKVSVNEIMELQDKNNCKL